MTGRGGPRQPRSAGWHCRSFVSLRCGPPFLGRLGWPRLRCSI